MELDVDIYAPAVTTDSPGSHPRPRELLAGLPGVRPMAGESCRREGEEGCRSEGEQSSGRKRSCDPERRCHAQHRHCYPERACHPEPIRCAQGKLREGSPPQDRTAAGAVGAPRRSGFTTETRRTRRLPRRTTKNLLLSPCHLRVLRVSVVRCCPCPHDDQAGRPPGPLARGRGHASKIPRRSAPRDDSTPDALAG